MIDRIVEVIGFILALSIASERLVEIIKGILPWLNEEKSTPKKEGIRRSLLQILAVFSGVLTAFLSKDTLPVDIDNLSFVVLGLLASGGSGFWNAILTYLLEVKNLKKAEAKAPHSLSPNPVPGNALQPGTGLLSESITP
ncbi:hypothetical protein [Acaryochloris sp. CCMEE 5410]|uniref:hypothetical protein n=1 Tax=Acaryochloris sp. CCMEE 5410 TaxID=310037 RepID=UPI0002484532|nr:hypothetical protein [Acaryochloris sp. CCMEE 5410]KAI9134863.1 hypothetical protein ON05_017465 [Acaryochloris sp. CCMEE 5410]